jgi:acyl dehydratase
MTEVPDRDAYAADVAARTIYWENVPVGFRHQWRRTVTQDAVDAYCDGAEDYNPWYGPDASPFGPPVVPPMLVSRLCRFTMEELGVMLGWVHVSQRNELCLPVPVGSELIFDGEVTAKYERRGRHYVDEQVIVRRSEDHAVVLRHARTYVAPRKDGGET